MVVHPVARRIFQGLVCMGLVCSYGFAANDSVAKIEKKAPTREELFAPSFMQKLSETYGHLIAKSLDNPVLKMDSGAIIKGLQDAQSGKAAPLSDKEYEEAFTLIQQYAFEDKANQNLKDAEAFLQKNKAEAGVIEIEAGKIQYKVVQ